MSSVGLIGLLDAVATDLRFVENTLRAKYREVKYNKSQACPGASPVDEKPCHPGVLPHGHTVTGDHISASPHCTQGRMALHLLGGPGARPWPGQPSRRLGLLLGPLFEFH